MRLASILACLKREPCPLVGTSIMWHCRRSFLQYMCGVQEVCLIVQLIWLGPARVNLTATFFWCFKGDGGICLTDPLF
uniref:Uncharacterized protein n=1 Tax=Anguilla anguilla TaxID=7936 RepID=A0A0E9XAY9_ANGAN